MFRQQESHAAAVQLKHTCAVKHKLSENYRLCFISRYATFFFIAKNVICDQTSNTKKPIDDNSMGFFI